ncbi:MAG: hypothetical protein EZS28_035638, partial [Streblomastix strix]
MSSAIKGIRYNSIGLVGQVTNINNKINNINNAPAPEVYIRPEANEIFDIKADKTDTYSKTETDTLLEDKVDKSELIDSYSKTEDDAFLLLKANVIDIVDSYSKTEDDALLLLKTNKPDSYSKTETDTLLDTKAKVADIVDNYSMTEDDALLLLKADKSDIYIKTQADTLLDAKTDKTELIDSYSKTEDDALSLLKANVADLSNYVDLTSTQTISGQKQFGIISVSRISKMSKNDASIHLLDGEVMLVSSIVAQQYLQEVKDIASGKSKVYVYSTQGELNDSIAVQENVAKLVIGYNLYIVDKEVMDYWWDEIDLKMQEMELSDMSNVIATLETATGGGNAIINISIDEIGIMVQRYDNSSVVCAGGGVRSIADIQSVSYSKSEDEALLLLKADKTQPINSDTKIETNNHLNNKADNEVSYTKGENEALLLLKADKTQLIDSYTKIETNNLINNKTDSKVSYTKSEDDTLLLLKADRIQLIDSYTKIETNY